MVRAVSRWRRVPYSPITLGVLLAGAILLQGLAAALQPDCGR
jgi:hypothetical protein